MLIKFFEKYNKLSWIIVFIGACLIFYISSITFSSGLSSGTNILAISYHISAFFCLGFCLLISLVRGREDYRSFFIGIIISVLYAISDEVHQYFVPGRACALFDIFLDSTGIVLAGMIYLVIILLRKRLSH